MGFRRVRLTSGDGLLEYCRLSTLDGLLRGLRLQYAADISRAALIQRTLERIPLPAEDVVAMLRISTPANFCQSYRTKWNGIPRRNLLVASAPDEGL